LHFILLNKPSEVWSPYILIRNGLEENLCLELGTLAKFVRKSIRPSPNEEYHDLWDELGLVKEMLNRSF
jgi:hypothetical protein